MMISVASNLINSMFIASNFKLGTYSFAPTSSISHPSALQSQEKMSCSHIISRVLKAEVNIRSLHRHLGC